MIRAILFRAVVLIASALGLFALLEVGLRLMWEPDNPPGMVRKHATRHYELRPGYSGRTYDAPLEVNSRGERGPERAVSFDPDALRVVVLGDSMVFGIGTRAEQSFAGVLERQLQAHWDGPVQVFNLGIPSYNTEDQRLYLIESHDTYRPHLVILQYMYGNDANPKERPRPQTGWRRLPGVQALREIPSSSWAIGWLWRQTQRLQYLIGNRNSPRHSPTDQLRAATRHMLSAVYTEDAPGWIEVRRSLKGIASFCARRNIPLVMGVYANDMNLDAESRRILEPAIKRVLEGAQASGIEHLIVLDEAYAEYAGREELLWVRPDDAHWSALAHELVAKFVHRYLLEHDELLPAPPRAALRDG